MMDSIKIEEILRSQSKPKEKQARLVDSILTGAIPIQEFMDYFTSAQAVEQGTCADVLKHLSMKNPGLISPYIPLLVGYINHPLPRVKWGIPETIGNLAQDFPEQTAAAIPNLIKNTCNETGNTTVVRWCAAYALAEIAKHNQSVRTQLLPLFDGLIGIEQNSGVKNVYTKAIKAINKEKAREYHQ